jgi:hypothetical protein
VTESGAGSGRSKVPDPLGKRALFWAPGSPGASRGKGADSQASSTVALPVGKRALYSGARPEKHSILATSENPLVDRGSITVECERCHQTSHVGVLDLFIYQFPFAGWLPRGKYDRRMNCPSCRKRAWCSVTLRRS